MSGAYHIEAFDAVIDAFIGWEHSAVLCATGTAASRFCVPILNRQFARFQRKSQEAKHLKTLWKSLVCNPSCEPQAPVFGNSIISEMINDFRCYSAISRLHSLQVSFCLARRRYFFGTRNLRLL